VTTPAGPITRARASLEALEVLDRLDGQPGKPSSADLDALRGWAGWGPMAPAFSATRTGTWQEIGERVEWLLPPDRLAEAQQATPNAFYTPAPLATACWEILRELGFEKGRILEPGCGAGAFMAATPSDIEANWTGIERDPTTARIAQLLHPDAQILNARMESAALPAHVLDAVIGNVPFGETPVYDPTAPKEVAASLHNYCIWRSVRSLRPGGIAVLITSRYTMDSYTDLARSAIAAEADLVGAIRLPNAALKPGGTNTVTDIMVLRRRTASTPATEPAWVRTEQLWDIAPDAGWRSGDCVNRWFVDHPDMILGDLLPDHAAQYGRTVRVHRDESAEPLPEALAAAATRLTASARTRHLTWDAVVIPTAASTDLGIPDRDDGRKERSYHLIGGTVHQVQNGQLTATGARGKELAELTALIGLRDAAVTLLDAEADFDRDEESLAPLRRQLNAAYDRYVTTYGPVNRCTLTEGEPDPDTGLATISRRRPRMGGFRQDPDYATVLALEDYDDETGQAAKTAIFRQRVNQPITRPSHADTAEEAIRLCLDSCGKLDLPVIARLLGITDEHVPEHLHDLAYLDPATGNWVTADEYLSGDVRDKLARARAAGEADPDRWADQVRALERVQPPDLGPEEIRAKLGAPWIPADDVRAFAAETLGHAPTVSCLPVTSQWEVKIDRYYTTTAQASEEWGTGRADGYRLLELALNGKAPVVYDTIQTSDGESRVRNQAETMLAEEKQQSLSARFAEWAWEDPKRADRLATEYNRLFNSVVLRRYDGSHLTFPGLTDDFTPYAHQRDMVHRIISTKASLCPYPVGTGKTPTMFMAARKLRELGLARKPLIVVPNHLLEQTAREGKRLFPAARILMATRDDLADLQGRKVFAARCATGDWDAIVMTHSAFTAIPVHPATEAAHLAEIAARYRAAIAEGEGGSRTVKKMAKLVDAAETRARKLLDHRTDNGVCFEHLGADFLMVDEAHYFKNLGIPVHTDGFSVPASKRAADLDMKLGVLRERGTREAALFTGTPVSNSLLEMYVLQHYLQPERLDALGLQSADAWAASFVQFQTSVEVAPDGASFRMKRRPAKFENVPELLTLFGEVADLRPPEAFAVQRPDARHENVVIDSCAELRDYVATLADRADQVRSGTVHADQDNMLKICSDGRKAALDLDLIGITSPDPGKIGTVVERVAGIYHDTQNLELPGDEPAGPRGGLQIVFCDLGTPSKAAGTQVYGKIRAGLVNAGIPAGQIRFIHDAGTDTQKAALFADCRAGKVSVLLGSTDKLGVGTNIQTRCVALHHVDAPWRPADVEQREGRALRPGNLNPAVDLYRYISEGSFDSYMWQTLERKARFIGQVLGGRTSGRDVDDIGDATLSYAEVKALATGNPLLLDLAEANAEVARLRSLSTGHVRGIRRLEDSVRAWQSQIRGKTELAEACDAVAQTAGEAPDQVWRNGPYTAIAEADVPAHLAGLVDQAITSRYGVEVVHWRGLRIAFSSQKTWRELVPVATVSAGYRDLTVDLKQSWTASGQHWRIVKEITACIDGAPDRSRALREEAQELRHRVDDATRRIAEPFPYAAQLEAARTRRDAIDAEILAAAAPDRDDSPVPKTSSDPDRLNPPADDTPAQHPIASDPEPGSAQMPGASSAMSPTSGDSDRDSSDVPETASDPDHLDPPAHNTYAQAADRYPSISNPEPGSTQTPGVSSATSPTSGDDTARSTSLTHQDRAPIATTRPLVEQLAASDLAREDTSTRTDGHEMPPLSPATRPATPLGDATARGTGLVIEHHQSGTLVHGTVKEDLALRRILHDRGFRWSARIGDSGAWYLPRPWGYSTRNRRVHALRADLEGLGRAHAMVTAPGAARSLDQPGGGRPREPQEASASALGTPHQPLALPLAPGTDASHDPTGESAPQPAQPRLFAEPDVTGLPRQPSEAAPLPGAPSPGPAPARDSQMPPSPHRRGDNHATPADDDTPDAPEDQREPRPPMPARARPAPTYLTAEPLFEFPADTPAASTTPAKPRTARTRTQRRTPRTAAQIAAADNPPELTLFDIPAPPDPPPRATTPSARSTARRSRLPRRGDRDGRRNPSRSNPRRCSSHHAAGHATPVDRGRRRAGHRPPGPDPR
jgi:N12 class adenine-specific DNA methylase